MSAYTKTEFRGWTIPGPIPPGAHTHLPVVETGESLDAISGHFRIFQLQNGHRFSTDDILTAWYGSSWVPTAAHVLDLGSGIGTVALITAWRLQAAHFVTIEAQRESVRLARKSVAWNGLTGRFDFREGDFRDEAIFKPNEQFDLVLGSPPYFPVGSGIEGDHPQKVACRFETRGNIADYCAVAARRLAPGGWLACVFPIAPAEQRERVLAAAQAAALTIVRMRPVVLREGERPLLGLFGMVKSADLPQPMRERTWTEPPLIIRRSDGSIHPEYSAVKMSFGFPP